MKSLFKITLLLSMLGISRGVSQEDQISTSFRIVSWAPEKPSQFGYISAGEPVKVEGVNNSLRSVFLDYKGPSTLLLYDVSAMPDTSKPAGSPGAPAPIARIFFPPGIKHPLVLLLPVDGNPSLYRTVVFEDDPAKFPFGTYFFQNFSAHKVAADISGERFIVDPEKSQHLVSSDKKALHLQLAVFEDTNEGWRKIADSFYPNWKERRTVIFIYDSMRDGHSRMETRTLLESQAAWEYAIAAKGKAKQE